MKPSLGLSILVLSLLPGIGMGADGSIAVYFDANGTQPVTGPFDVTAFTPDTLYVIAKLEGSTAGGIAGAVCEVYVDFPPQAQVILSEIGPAQLLGPDALPYAACPCLPGPCVLLSRIQIIAFGNTSGLTATVTQLDYAALDGPAPPAFYLCDDDLVFTLVPATTSANTVGCTPTSVAEFGGETTTALHPLLDPGSGAPVSIRYRIGAGPVLVRLAVYNVAGRLVRVLDNGMRETGEFVRAWDRRDDRGRPAARGVYLVRLNAGTATLAGKVVLHSRR